MERYVFSGNLTQKMCDYLKAIPNFKPIDALVSQLDRSSVKAAIEHIEKDGVIKSLFIDSGAYSQYTGKCGKIDIDEYIDYVNSLDDYTCMVAELDTLPGKFGDPKHPQDYIESADKSWESYLYMRKRMKSPEKLIPVMHHGEAKEALLRILNWRDPDVEPGTMKMTKEFGEVPADRVVICGLSPANDSSQATKDNYLAQCYDVIKHSSYPDIKTHLFGMTSLQALAKFPCFSADSVSHRLRSAYNKIFTIKWGTISLSDRSRTSKTKSNMSFVKTCDPKTLKELEEICASRNFTIDQLCTDNAARTAFDICEIQKAIEGPYKYKEGSMKKQKSLFKNI